jgi:hypothetical protein
MGGRAKSPTTKDLISAIREARDFEKTIQVPAARRGSFTFNEIKGRIDEIYRDNRKIESAVRLEVLGLSDNPLSMIAYKIKEMIFGEGEPAEEIILRQTRRVDEIGRDLQSYASFMEDKLTDLEQRYDSVLISLLEKHRESANLAEGLAEKERMLTETRQLAESSDDPADKLGHLHSHRRIRKDLQANMHRIGMNERAISILRHELPLLDSLGDVTEAYVFTLRGIVQESELMSQHLAIVSSLYTNMMRSHYINFDFSREMGKLFSYAHNMGRTLESGAELVVKRASSSSFVESSYIERSLSLDSAISQIEGAASRAFEDLERRLSGYSSKNERRAER